MQHFSRKLFASVVLTLSALMVGCQTNKVTVMSLEGQTVTPEPPYTVKEKGTYYLFASLSENSPVYKLDLKKGDQIGFKITEKRGIAWANGVQVYLVDWEDKVNYYWKIDEKK